MTKTAKNQMKRNSENNTGISAAAKAEKLRKLAKALRSAGAFRSIN